MENRIKQQSNKQHYHSMLWEFGGYQACGIQNNLKYLLEKEKELIYYYLDEIIDTIRLKGGEIYYNKKLQFRLKRKIRQIYFTTERMKKKKKVNYKMLHEETCKIV